MTQRWHLLAGQTALAEVDGLVVQAIFSTAARPARLLRIVGQQFEVVSAAPGLVEGSGFVSWIAPLNGEELRMDAPARPFSAADGASSFTLRLGEGAGVRRHTGIGCLCIHVQYFEWVDTFSKYHKGKVPAHSSGIFRRRILGVASGLRFAQNGRRPAPYAARGRALCRSAGRDRSPG